MKGQLKSVSKQLRIEDQILSKSGRPVVPPSMRKCVITEYHKNGHVGSEKLFSIMQSGFYWPGMRKYLNNHVATCKICGQCKVGTTPKAPLVSMYNPQAPMEFIALDIAYMPVDTE